jgi:hypothetical protein
MTGIDFSDYTYVDPDWLLTVEDGDYSCSNFSGPHEGVIVAVGSCVEWIDKGIAPLIHAIWRCGIRTTASCQDVVEDGSVSHVEFATMEDLSTFLSLVAREDGIPGGLSDRATGSNLDPKRGGTWEYMITPIMFGRRPSWEPGIFFPPTDIPELVNRLEAAIT